MEIAARAAIDVAKSSDFTSYESGIDQEDVPYILEILSEKLYSDPIGSLIREITSNAYDSHVEAGVNDPIIVGIQKDLTENYWFCRDNGVGLSPERISEVYRKFGKSTKRNDKKSIGSFGFGKWSILAYSDNGFIDTVFNGKKYSYIIYKADRSPRIDLISEENTQEGNSTTIRVKIKNNTDLYEFQNQTKNVLQYFENIQFYGINGIDNYKIIKGRNFVYSTINTSSQLGLTLGQVNYQLNFQKLGISPIPSSLNLRFALDEGVFPIPNREQLEYNTNSIEIIKNKINLLADELVNIYNSQISDTTNIRDVEDYYRNSNFYITLDNTYKIEVSRLLQLSKKPKLGLVFKPCPNVDFSHYRIHNSFLRYKPYSVVSYGRRKKTRANIFSLILDNNYKIILLKDPKSLSSVKNKYLQELYNTFYFITEESSSMYTIVDEPSYRRGKVSLYNMFNLKNVKKENWRKVLTEYKDWEDSIINKIEVYEDIKIPQTWLDNYKLSNKKTISNRKKIDPNTEIITYGLREPDRWCDDLVFEKSYTKLKDLNNIRKVVIYGDLSEEDELSKYFVFSTNFPNIIINSTKRSNFKIIENIPNFIHFTEFKNKCRKLYSKFITAKLIRNTLINYDSYLLKFIHRYEGLNNSYFELLHKLNNYSNKYLFSIPRMISNKQKYIDFIEQIYKEGIDNKYYDLNALNDFNKINKDLPKFDFIRSLSPGEHHNFIVEVLKYRKFRLHFTYYQNKEKEKVLEENKEENGEVNI